MLLSSRKIVPRQEHGQRLQGDLYCNGGIDGLPIQYKRVRWYAAFSHQFPVCCLSNVSRTMMIFSLFNMVKWVASLWWWQWFFWVSQPVPDPAAPRSVVLVMAPCSCPLHVQHSDTSVTPDDDGWQVLRGRELAATWTEKQIKYSALYLHNSYLEVNNNFVIVMVCY